MNIEDIAKICHEANRAYCETLGDNSQLRWEEAQIWQRGSAIKGVRFNLENPDATLSDTHNSWVEEKRKEGWKYGKIKNIERKEHPCFAEYTDLPDDQKAKDAIFKAIVLSLRPYIAAWPAEEEAA